ncbi:MAG: hydrogenase formation protein HypD [Anaerolinea sp.]|nr:hydrogenase formation protein HypD [Anaerolinea sp.]
MKYTDEFRDAARVKQLADDLRGIIQHPWVIMEICGGQTHSFMHYGIDQLLPPEIELVHGPGCPVCVTPLEMIDKAIALASDSGFILTSYGDMLRVPGSNQDLFSVRASGGAVKVVYSPLDAVQLARDNPDKQVVFFAIGFETTTPANAMSIIQAESLGIKNFSLLVSQVRVPPAMEAILSSPANRVQGFLAAGHVCAVMGFWEYLPIAEKYQIPMAVTGFEPVDLLKGLNDLVTMLEQKKVGVINSYPRAVTLEGNMAAQASINRVFQPSDRAWRGIGTIPMSGFSLRPEYVHFDAEKRFDLGHIKTRESEVCIAGQVLQGVMKPPQCPGFGTLCTPENPLGAPMVSAEGACSAYYRYKKMTS